MATSRSELYDQPQVADLFGAALGRSEHGVIILDKHLRVVFWNNWMAEASGVAQEVALGRELRAVFEEPLPKRLVTTIQDALVGRQAASLSRTLNPKLFPLQRAVAGTDRSENIEHQVTIKPLDARNGRFCLVEIVDVTHAIHRDAFLKKQSSELRALADQLRENERELRNLLDSCPVGAVIVDEEGLVRFSNRAFSDIALSEGTAIAGDRLSSMFVEPTDLHEQITQTVKRVEVRLRRHGGSELWAQVSAEPTTFNGNAATLCWIHDVSEQKATERALSSERDRATEQARARTEFLTMVSHEIRTPLNGILGTVRMLADTGLSPIQSDFVETIQYSGDSLLAILNDVLDMSRLDAGHIDLERSDIDLHRLAESLMTLMEPRAKERSNRLSLSIENDVPRHIETDPGRLRQILLNLVGNAIKFTQDGNIDLHIECLDKNAENLRLRFSVKDTGIGIPENARARLFTEFFQVDAARARHLGGTGLGLAISKRIVEAMGGVIGVESKEGAGSTFWFSIGTGSGKGKADNARKLAPRRILLVEDNEINQLVAQNILAQDGHSVTTVDNGLDAFREAERQDLDLILMDIQLPQLNGIEATRQIRALANAARAGTPIVALTADALPTSARDCLDAGMNEVLTKPIDPVRLTRVIEGLTSPSPVPVPQSGTMRVSLEDVRVDVNMLQSLRNMIGEEKVDELIELFHGTCQDTITEIVAAASARDMGEVYALAHRLKGGALNLGFGAVSECAIALEQAAKSGDEAATLEPLINSLTQAYSMTMNALGMQTTGA
jgi:PAS domain S-box-containing protein